MTRAALLLLLAIPASADPPPMVLVGVTCNGERPVAVVIESRRPGRAQLDLDDLVPGCIESMRRPSTTI